MTAQQWEISSRKNAHDELATRLGPSPTDSCKRIRIRIRHVERVNEQAQHAPQQSEAAGAMTAADESTRVVRLSVDMATIADFNDVEAYLCQMGCALQVTPWRAEDWRPLVYQ